MSLSTLNNSFTPYSLSGLQNVNVDTINGTSPFNGVISNTYYPLSYNTSTGILSQSPIGQSVETSASPTFQRVYLNNASNYISNNFGALTITSGSTLNINSGNILNFIGSQIVLTGTGTGTSGGLSFNANANISCGSGLDLILTTLGTADNILFVSGTTQKFKINSSGIYAPSLSSVSQTYVLGYNLSTGQITYQSPPTVPLSITVNNITSQTATNLTLDGNLGINFNVNGTTYAQITSTGLLVNNVGSIGGLDLSLSSSTGVITTASSFSLYGGNLNLFDFSTGLLQSQLLTASTGLIIRGPTTKDIRLQIAFTNIMIIDASGINIQGSLPIKSATNTNLILNCPTVGYQMNLQHAGTTKAAITTNGLTIWNNNLYTAGATLNFKNSTASTASILMGNLDTINNPFIGFVNTLGNNAGYLQSNYVSASVSNLYMSSTGTIEIEAAATSSIIMDVGSTNLTVGSGGITTFGNVDITGTGQLSGLLTQNFPVNLWYKSYTATYAAPTIYQSTSATNFTNVGTAVNNGLASFFNYSACNSTTQNWTPIWGTTASTYGFLYFPYKGVYNINWSFGVNAPCVFITTINKNWSLANWSASPPVNDSSMLSCLSLSPSAVYNATVSATIRIDTAGTSGDYVCFCYYNFSANTTVGANNFRSPLNIHKVA